MSEQFKTQTRLLVQSLPFVAEETDFALKGGTAINLFYRNLPRYSVDIDLVYVPVKDRNESLRSITQNLMRLSSRIREALPQVTEVTDHLNSAAPRDAGKVFVQTTEAQIKIEVSPVLRGTLFDPEPRSVSEHVEQEFGFAAMPLLVFEEIFAGKIVAALDRAHPRDLYDVKLLLDREGISDQLFRVLLIYLISSRRPVHELLNPKDKNIEEAYLSNFQGMSIEPVSLDDLYAARRRLVQQLRDRTTGDAASFLESVHECRPDFRLINLDQAADLPAVRWKLQNLRKFKADNPRRHAEQLEALRETFVK
ncbi:MAG: nucleotidyl transferase AbiEii/AbiGii toxin family protein [Gammaproteobacteria bacterium AqS3]|nr:nucleotidyl transferase AbiEii/AbiGii toxin family protein [Gammaproteobacteria bacterium AqS3]